MVVGGDFTILNSSCLHQTTIVTGAWKTERETHGNREKETVIEYTHPVIYREKNISNIQDEILP